MATLIDTSVWIDAFHSRTPMAVKAAAAAAIGRNDAVICEPVHLEFFRGVPEKELARAQKFLATIPLLHTPASLWRDALSLLRTCGKNGVAVNTLDALIGAVAQHHDATIATFDQHFLMLEKHCGIAVELLPRPA